jgi:hypothetical protein
MILYLTAGLSLPTGKAFFIGHPLAGHLQESSSGRKKYITRGFGDKEFIFSRRIVRV